MAIKKLFSFRKREALGERPDIYRYDAIPEALKIQLILAIYEFCSIHDRIRDSHQFGSNGYMWHAFTTAKIILLNEHALFSLPCKIIRGMPNYSDDTTEVFGYFLHCGNTDKTLDIIEAIFHGIKQRVSLNFAAIKSPGFPTFPEKTQEHTDMVKNIFTILVNNINARFKQHGIGYQVEDDVVIRIDSELIHTEITKPSLYFLSSNSIFIGARSEMFTAYENYRNGRYKEAITDAGKAFESTLKAACELKGWMFDPEKDTAQKLINICLTNGLLPKYLQEHYSQLNQLLLNSNITIRNKKSAHGQGVTITDVSESLTAYALHLASTNIQFIAKQIE